MNKVSIELGKLTNQSINFNDDQELGYRILIETPDKHGVIPIKFAREKDAQAGLNGLLKHVGLYNLSSEEITSKFEELGPEGICKIVCEEMAW